MTTKTRQTIYKMKINEKGDFPPLLIRISIEILTNHWIILFNVRVVHMNGNITAKNGDLRLAT